MSLAAGSHLGPYEILAPIGAGGMGKVYRAHDTKLSRDVAIKVLPRSWEFTVSLALAWFLAFGQRNSSVASRLQHLFDR